VNRDIALDLAIAAMQRECRRFAVDATLCETMGLRAPSAVRASETWRELTAAVALLRTLKTKQEAMEL